MMKKLLFILSYCIIGNVLLHAQNTLIFTENFETGGGTFSLNSAGPGSNSGTNQWIVNNQYSGAPTYPTTMSEDSTYSGTISFAPHSQYLHIYDQPSGITNCNYNPSASSDRFANMASGLCTLGMDSVHFSFFYMCEGSATAYGQVYYSINGGPWIQTGLGQYNNRYKWKYEDITDPAFANVNNLRFGFRWVNTAGPSADSVSLAIDDINMVGNYNTNVTLTVDSVSPNPVCQGGLLYIYWHLSDTLCDGTYSIDLSTSTGTFPGPAAWVASIYYPQTSGLFAIILPQSATAGTCYKIRIRRTSPAPIFTGIASACFTIVACPTTITTLQPVVTFDTNAVCVHSAIDVPFYSTGTFNATNTYFAQLSNSSGVFSSNPPLIGSFISSTTFDPALGSLPGTVSGLIPTVPPGCGYYIRVVSNNPSTIGIPWGPFCIGDCDVLTNNAQDIHVCVTDCAINPAGANAPCTINVNYYNNTAVYGPTNIFESQLLSSMNFAQIGADGIVGSVAATGDTTMTVHIPCKDSLPIVGIPIGMNYLRVAATDCSVPDNSLGSLIRLTVGAPRSTGATISSYDFTTFAPRDTFCVGDIVALFFSPYNYSDNSTYLWTCNGINGGNPFPSLSGANSNSLYVNLGAPGLLTFSVQENSFGCAGPWSPIHSILVLGPPSSLITGPHVVCVGDTNTYTTTFNNSTYYSWGTSGGIIVDTSNNVIDMSYPNAGTYQLMMNAINQCGSVASSINITVRDYPVADAGNDTVVCDNNPITLSTPTGTGYIYNWSNGISTVGNQHTLTVTPTVTTTYYLMVSVSGGCITRDTITVIVNSFNADSSSTPSGCMNNVGTATATTIGGSPPYTFLWNNGQTTQTATGLSAGTYTCDVTDGNGCMTTITAIVNGGSSIIPDAGIYTTITSGQSTQLSGSGGVNYFWAPGASLSCNNCQNPVASPSVTTTYTLTVTDSLGCTATDTVTVFVDIDCGVVGVPNAFSPNGDGQNDVLYVKGGECIKFLEFRVYNRWGEQVFYSSDATKGWDGVWRGEPCEAAVFTYVLRATLLDDSTVNKQGNISLVK
jgi:gliding motility-associated-like protein